MKLFTSRLILLSSPAPSPSMRSRLRITSSVEKPGFSTPCRERGTAEARRGGRGRKKEAGPGGPAEPQAAARSAPGRHGGLRAGRGRAEEPPGLLRGERPGAGAAGREGGGEEVSPSVTAPMAASGGAGGAAAAASEVSFPQCSRRERRPWRGRRRRRRLGPEPAGDERAARRRSGGEGRRGGPRPARNRPPGEGRPRQVSGRRGREAEVPAPAARLHLPTTAPPAPPPPARAAPPCPRHMARALRRPASSRGPGAEGAGESGRAPRPRLGTWLWCVD